MRLPDFIIIGAAKAGTTTLYEYLLRHPQVYMSTPKEPEFFARDENYAKGIEWYADLFKEADAQKICGEASTIYTRYPVFPKSPERIAQVMADVKLIYIMRHPVDRAYSHYVQRIKTGQNTKTKLEVTQTFEQAIDAQKDLFIDSSNYIKQIEHYLQCFSRDCFLFLLMEDLLENPAETLSKVCNFIGVDPTVDMIGNELIAANMASTHKQWFLRSRMTAPLKKIPGMARIAALLPPESRDFAYEVLSKLPYRQSVEKKYLPQPMLPETRTRLLEYFRESNQRLSELLNRDLSHWSN